MKYKKLIYLLLLWWVPNSFQAQQVVSELTLEDIYRNGIYQTRGHKAIKWMQDGSGYTTLDPSPDFRGVDIVRNVVVTGERKVLLSAEKLIPDGHDLPLDIADYIWSSDHTKLLIFTNTRKVWRLHTRGDYWVFDFTTDQLTQLGEEVERTSMMFAKFSPDGTKVAYVSKNDIYVEDLQGREMKQVTSDGSQHIINGTFDWVYEEELRCRDGFRWSPDGQHIAYWQSDTKGTGTFYMINNIDSVYSQLMPLPYPKVGTNNSAVKVGVISIDGGETRWFDIPGDPRNNYLARMEFIPNSNEVMIQQLNRLQNTNTVWVGDIEDLSLTMILRDHDRAFLDVHDNIVWIDDETSFIWTSERDGWLRLYRVSRNGARLEPLMTGDFDVVRVNCVDRAGGYVYFTASPENYTQRYLYRSRLDGKGKAERVSPMDQPGQHSYIISDNAKWAIHTYHHAKMPQRISLIQLPDHQDVKLLEDNAALKSKYAALDLNPKEFIKVDIGEAVLDAWMIKPKGFMPRKKYPLLIYVYGEPAGSTVQDSWSGGDLWHHYLAQEGYIMVSIDNRGTRTPRGRAWRKSIYGQIGILAAHDQAQAAQQLFKTYSYIDTSRVGMWGWSGGGQMTMNCLFRFPEIYQAGLAVSFVADQRLYDNIYQERYMGLLPDNEANYIAGSPITHAKNLEGDLMIIHGTADDNVHYQNFERMANELIKHNKMFDMMSYPMRAHGISERENTSLHLRETMIRYWKRVLPTN